MMWRNSFVVPALAGLCGSLVCSHAATFTEDFSTDPSGRWGRSGDASLFQWNAAGQHLAVTWDSSRSNSYYYRSLGTVLSRDDDFSLSFDLQVNSLAVGVTPGKPNTFQLAIGLLNLGHATSSNFVRGSGFESPNLVEFDYFQTTSPEFYGSSFSTLLVSTNCGHFAWSDIYQELAPGDRYNVAMTYSGSSQSLVTVLTRNAQVLGTSTARLTNFTDFRVDSFSINSYSDAGQDPGWSGSILAAGQLDNVVLTTPPPPIAAVSGSRSNQVWTCRFASRTNWNYHLQGGTNFNRWTTVDSAAGTGDWLTLQDTNVQALQFYRVLAEKP